MHGSGQAFRSDRAPWRDRAAADVICERPLWPTRAVWDLAGAAVRLPGRFARPIAPCAGQWEEPAERAGDLVRCGAAAALADPDAADRPSAGRMAAATGRSASEGGTIRWAWSSALG